MGRGGWLRRLGRGGGGGSGGGGQAAVRLIEHILINSISPPCNRPHGYLLARAPEKHAMGAIPRERDGDTGVVLRERARARIQERENEMNREECRCVCVCVCGRARACLVVYRR